MTKKHQISAGHSQLRVEFTRGTALLALTSVTSSVATLTIATVTATATAEGAALALAMVLKSCAEWWVSGGGCGRS